MTFSVISSKDEFFEKRNKNSNKKYLENKLNDNNKIK